MLGSRPPADRFDRVEVTDPRGGGVWAWLARYYAFAACALAGTAALAALGAYAHFAAGLPVPPPFEKLMHDAARPSTVRAWDGTPLAELGAERREVLPHEAFPPRLVQAVLAIEDRRFHEHGGIDLRGTIRALLANLRAGAVVQGASTITQQVARSSLFLGSSQQTVGRKIREAILARRLEAAYDKRQILTLYLNGIFLGHQSYGVAAAARRFFDRPLSALDLGELATIAGIAQQPSRFSPLVSPDATRARRDQVLDAMVRAGTVPEAEAAAARARPLVARPAPELFRVRSPYFAEHVRRVAARRYPEERLWRGGLQFETTLVPSIDLAAQENVDFSLRKLDKRQGWRGPVARLHARAADEFRRRAAERHGAEPLEEGRLYLGLVENAGPKGAEVLVGRRTFTMPPSEMTWAFPWSATDATNQKTLANPAGLLRRGDVVWVAPAHRSKQRRFADWTYDDKNEVRWLPATGARPAPPGPTTVRLEQTPHVQGAILSYDHRTGYVLALVGGHDYDRSEFNRVTQACRQPGSTYKPVYYSLALDRGYGYGSLLNDTPRAEVDPITGEVWIPTNLNNTVEYQVRLDYALVWSKNVPSVQLFKLVGGKEVEAWARRLGFSTPIIPDQALALGASCVRMDELTRAFSAFARGGSLVEPLVIRRVRDRDGQVVEDSTAPGDPMGAPSERLDRLVALAGPRTADAIPPRTAWLTSQLLRRAITHGHSPSLRGTGLPAAGKTGTSSATMDVWFVGYTSRWMTTTWIGDDRRERPLGHKDAAFMLTVPMFARYMWEVTDGGRGLAEIPWERPAGVRPGDTGGTLRTTMDEVKEDGAGAAVTRQKG